MTHENETALGMDQDTNIALGVSAIPIIKNDILTVAGQMDAAVYDGVLSECEKKLSTKIDEVFNEFNSSNSTDKESLFEQLNTLFEGQSDMQAVITKLRNAIISLETGGEEGSVLSEETIKNVLNAALTSESFWSDDTIGASSVVGQKIIGLVGTFGKIKTENLEGTLIEGKTVQSIPDSEGNIAWQLNNAGNGHLANGNISWNENGDVTFGEGVKIKWDNVDEKPNIPEAGVTESDVNSIISTTITKDYIESLKVRATDIIGDTITGKTIKSSENEWEIQDGGTAKFANNRVCFNADGSGWIGKRDNGMAVLSWKKDGTIEASNTTEYDASNKISGRMGVNPSTLFTAGIYLCSGDVQLEKTGDAANRANLPAGVYTFVNTTGSPIKLTLPRFNNTANRGLIITIPAYCGADVRFVYNSAGQFEFIPLVGATVEETLL